MNNGARSPAMQPVSSKSPGPMFAGAGMGGMGAGVNGSMAGQRMQGFTGKRDLISVPLWPVCCASNAMP